MRERTEREAIRKEKKRGRVDVEGGVWERGEDKYGGGGGGGGKEEGKRRRKGEQENETE